MEGAGPPPSANLAGEDHPLLALAAADRARRDELPLEAEGRDEEAAHLAAGDRKGRAGAVPADRVEAGEEPAAGPEESGDDVDVARPPARVDGAEARVLPDAVEL